MCDQIRFNSGDDVGTVRQFQDRFNVDAKLYGFDGDEIFLDCCLCDIDLDLFFAEHTELRFGYKDGEWWENKYRNNDNKCVNCNGSGVVKTGEDEYSSCPCTNDSGSD